MAEEIGSASEVQVSIRGAEWILSGHKVLWWPSESLLVISDFHLGKSDHFRKNGIPMPGNMIDSELDRINTLVDLYEPNEVLFLGDLFHSVYNLAWERAVEFFAGDPRTTYSLVEGNHDIMDEDQYRRAGILHRGLVYEKGGFLFAHDRIDNLPDELYGVFGHIHPGVRLQGRGRQRMTLPCFCFRGDHLLMPAFGAFTGLARITPREEDEVYVVVDGSVLGL